MNDFQKAQKWLIVLFTLFVLGLPAVIVAGVLFKANSEWTLPVSAFTTGLCTLYILLDVRETARKRGLNLKKGSSKEEFDVSTLIGILAGICFSSFLIALISALIAMEIKPEIIMEAVFITAPVCYIAVITYIFTKKKGYKISFTKERLPIALTDYIVACLIAYISTVINGCMSWILICTGVLIAFTATLMLLARADKTDEINTDDVSKVNC